MMGAGDNKTLHRLDALIGELAERLPADDFLAEWAERYGDALEDAFAAEARVEAVATARRIELEQHKLTQARMVALEEALRAIGEFAASHSGRDGQDVVLAALYRIAEEAEAALASSVKQEKEGLGGSRSALSRAQEDQP